jgi:hypothetical protein
MHPRATCYLDEVQQTFDQDLMKLKMKDKQLQFCAMQSRKNMNQ